MKRSRDEADRRILRLATSRHAGSFLACLLGCAWDPALAQSGVIRPGEERFTIGLAIVLNSFAAELRVNNASLGQGSNVNLADTLGTRRDDWSYWAGAEWRFAPRHRIGFNISTFKLPGTRTISQQIQIGDEIYPAGATITSEFKLQIVPIVYSYSLIKSDRHEFAATVGVHWTRVRFTASGTASLSGGDVDADVAAKLDSPMPQIGLRYDHHLSQRWSVGLQGGAFSLSVGTGTTNIEGDAWNAAVYAEYRFARSLAVGLTIESFRLDVAASSSSWQGAIDYHYWGPQLYLKGRF
jgi:hypothetical protein